MTMRSSATGKMRPEPKSRNALGPRFQFVRGIAGNDRFLFIRPCNGQRHRSSSCVTFRSTDFSSKNRRTTSDMPSNGVNVSHTGPLPIFVRVKASV